MDVTYLGETNVLTLLTEALSTDIEAVFADQTGFVCAHATVVLMLGGFLRRCN